MKKNDNKVVETSLVGALQIILLSYLLFSFLISFTVLLLHSDMQYPNPNFGKCQNLKTGFKCFEGLWPWDNHHTASVKWSDGYFWPCSGLPPRRSCHDITRLKEHLICVRHILSRSSLEVLFNKDVVLLNKYLKTVLKLIPSVRIPLVSQRIFEYIESISVPRRRAFNR